MLGTSESEEPQQYIRVRRGVNACRRVASGPTVDLSDHPKNTCKALRLRSFAASVWKRYDGRIEPQPDPIVDLEAHREDTFQAALDRATPHQFVTPSLIAINVVVFVAMILRHVSAFSPPPETLIRWGANYGPMTTHGQWWRLLTSAFLHIGVSHLLVNMFVLWVIGQHTERLFGNGGFLVLYLLGALAGSLTSVSIHPTIVSAGASGAVFALYGGLIGFLLVRRSTMSYTTATSLAVNALAFVGFNLFFGLSKEHIDMAAHVGGLVAGVPIGAALAFDLGERSAMRLVRSVVVFAAGVAVMVPLARRVPAIDDWPAEFARWLATTRTQAARMNQLIDERRNDGITPEEMADRIEQEIVPLVEAERVRVASLRLPPSQKAIAQQTLEHLSKDLEALRLTAQGQRSGDRAVLDQAEAKRSEALEALQRVVPDPKLAAVLAERNATRAAMQALTAELDAISRLEREQAAIYNSALKKYRSNKLRPEDLGDVIEKELLPPWLAARDRLAKLQVVPSQDAHVKRVLEYMSLRSEGWRLIAAGLKSHDKRLVEQGTAKHAAAQKLIQTKGAEPLEPRSGGPETSR